MKILLVGYGKMGHMVEQVAHRRGHKIAGVIDSAEPGAWSAGEPEKADIAIEFSTPQSAVDNLRRCFEAHLPVVCGTTGWYDRMDEVRELCDKHGTALFYASNFSIGVYIFDQINARLAEIMEGYPSYDVSMEEIHHIHKQDYPSGTALTLAHTILEHLHRKKGSVAYLNSEPQPHLEDRITIHSLREGEVPGTHRVCYSSEVDEIRLEHVAKGREGFALGAVVAAEFLLGKHGVYTMRDLMHF